MEQQEVRVLRLRRSQKTQAERIAHTEPGRMPERFHEGGQGGGASAAGVDIEDIRECGESAREP
jgi:hypothetical protein